MSNRNYIHHVAESVAGDLLTAHKALCRVRSGLARFSEDPDALFDDLAAMLGDYDAEPTQANDVLATAASVSHLWTQVFDNAELQRIARRRMNAA